MTISPKGEAFIKKHESCRLQAYKDGTGKPTIGWGNTVYETGWPVKIGDNITQKRADELFKFWIEKFDADVDSLIKSTVNQNQFDALVSFAYNVGPDIDADTIAEGLGDSTLLKYVNADPDDPRIRTEFMKWNKGRVKGVLTVMNGLTNRRKAEADLYFS